MAHTYISSHFHCVFSTKERRPFITEDLQERLWPYIGGIARENKMKALAVGGVADHVHILRSLPATITVSKAMQLIKGGSSKWVHDEFPEHRRFAWQEGYGAFTVGVSQVVDTKRYVANQQEHHRKRSFQEEFIAFLEKHGIEYDPAHVGVKFSRPYGTTGSFGQGQSVFQSGGLVRWASEPVAGRVCRNIQESTASESRRTSCAA